jgi:hypothetical protein
MEKMVITTLAVAVVGVVLDLAMLVVTLAKAKPSRRARKREHYAQQAVAYAKQIGGSHEDKLRHAVESFRQLDMADNGKRDFSDGEIRLAIEAVLGARK